MAQTGIAALAQLSNGNFHPWPVLHRKTLQLLYRKGVAKMASPH